MTAIKLSAAREHGRRRSDVGLDAVGINAAANVYWNLNTPELYEEIARREGRTADFRHIPFGSILGEDRKLMKTRSGENVALRDVLDEAVVRARGRARLVCGMDTSGPPVMTPGARYAVLHASPMYRFRRWNDDEWRSGGPGLRPVGSVIEPGEGMQLIARVAGEEFRQPRVREQRGGFKERQRQTVHVRVQAIAPIPAQWGRRLRSARLYRDFRPWS